MARLAVRVHPRSSRNEARVAPDGTISIWTNTAPVDGAANEAACRLLATGLGIPLSAVRVVVGARSRSKMVDVDGITEAEALVRLREATNL